ncbi:MAG: NAD(P)H-dependent oxidoreductase [Candidatus Woesearchaeota archaeon]
MNTLIIYAHPGTDGHCSFILQHVLQELDAKKISYELLDLYAIDYDPILSREELYTSGNRHISETTKELQHKIKIAKNLILIYPTWWGGPPAILKGFFDKVFTPRFAFKFNKYGIPLKLLKGKRAALFITSGTQVLLSRIFQGGRPYKSVKNDVLEFSGIKTKAFQTGSTNSKKDKRKKAMLRNVKKGLNWLY